MGCPPVFVRPEYSWPQQKRPAPMNRNDAGNATSTNGLVSSLVVFGKRSFPEHSRRGLKRASKMLA